MKEQEVLRLLGEIGAVITGGHFVYTSGKHGADYVSLKGEDAESLHIEAMSSLCQAIAERFAGDCVETVIGPATGGVIISRLTAEHLSKITGCAVHSVYAEKDGSGGFVISPDDEKFIVGKNVLAVDDVLTAGGSAKKVIEAVHALGGYLVGLGVLCNRGGVMMRDAGNPPRLVALARVKLEAWDEADCPLCAQSVPINTDVGKGREFLARKKAGSV